MKKVLSFVAGTALLMAMCGMSAFADERTYLDPSTPEKVTIAEAKGDQEVVFANGTPITIVERTDGEDQPATRIFFFVRFHERGRLDGGLFEERRRRKIMRTFPPSQ